MIMELVAVKCNWCEWQGQEEDLKICLEDGEFYKGCPNCESEEYLMDIFE